MTEYTVGAVADIIAKLSQKNNHDSKFKEKNDDSSSKKKAKVKKRKLKETQFEISHEKKTVKKKKCEIINETDEISDIINNDKTVITNKSRVTIKRKKNKKSKKKLKEEKVFTQNSNIEEEIDIQTKKSKVNKKNRNITVQTKEKIEIRPDFVLTHEETQFSNDEVLMKKSFNGDEKSNNIDTEKQQNKSKKNINKKAKKNEQRKNKQTNDESNVKTMKNEKIKTADDLFLEKKDHETNTNNADKQFLHEKSNKGFPKHIGGINDSNNNESDKVLNEKEESRTIFVGNLPLEICRDKIINLFKKFGPIESVRFRSVPISDINLPRKACIKMKKIHEKRTNMNAYVRFLNKESVVKSVEMNGFVIDEHTIRVDCALRKDKNNSNAIFIGNLPFEAEEEELRKAFQCCGEIENVRIIRDRKTNTGKGFGYVNFKSSDSVAFALELENVKIRKRDIRIKRSFDKNSNSKFVQFDSKLDRFNTKSNFGKFDSKSSRNHNFNKDSRSHFNSKRGSNVINRPRNDFASKRQFNENRNFSNKRQSNENRNFSNKRQSNENRNFGDKRQPIGKHHNFERKKSIKEHSDSFRNKVNQNSFRGAAVEDNKPNKKKKKLGYDALKKFIIAKKLNHPGDKNKKKSFSFLTST